MEGGSVTETAEAVQEGEGEEGGAEALDEQLARRRRQEALHQKMLCFVQGIEDDRKREGKRK